MSSYLPYIGEAYAKESTTDSFARTTNYDTRKNHSTIEMHAMPEPVHTKQSRGEVHKQDVSQVQTTIEERIATNPNLFVDEGPSSAVVIDDQSHNLERINTQTSQFAVQQVVQTWRAPYMNRWRLFACCLAVFGNGMNDSAPGALLPYIEKYYGVNYSTVSTIFVASAIGFIASAFLTQWTVGKLGRAKTLALSDLLVIISYVIMAVLPPFPVHAIACFITGIAIAMQLALNCVFVANLANAAVIMGLYQAFYGLGGTVGPIMATALVSSGISFSRFYLVLLAHRALCLPVHCWSFWNFERHNKPSDDLPSSTAPSRHSQLRELKKAVANKVTLFAALFIFCYQGAEVSISGWVLNYLIAYRGGIPDKVGYVTAGFWAGITVGRATIPFLAKRIGDGILVYGLVVGAMGFQVLSWQVPNIVGASVGVALIGFLLGPIFACVTTTSLRLLPRSSQNTGLAFITSAGSSGGAVAPFTTGLLAQWVLHPVCLVLYVGMVVNWYMLNRGLVKRRE